MPATVSTELFIFPDEEALCTPSAQNARYRQPLRRGGFCLLFSPPTFCRGYLQTCCLRICDFVICGDVTMDIKLFVCCHRPVNVPKHPLLVPLQVGAALADSRFCGFLHDDVGENISNMNHSYCELTAQYWAWRNVWADYYGFFHYRRYLYPNVDTKLPYRIEQKATLSVLSKLGYGELGDLITQYDLILPKKEDMYISVREHYAQARFHHRKDLELVEQVIRERNPEITLAADQYLSGTACYFGNIYIMKRDIFCDYCAWLFSILKEFDLQKDTSGYCCQEQRVDGYLAERLLGIYATYCHNAKMLELPRVHFFEDPVELVKKRILNFILPPGSVRRGRVKAIMR